MTFAKRDLKHFYQTHQVICEVMDVLSNFTVVNILQCKYIYQTVIIYLQYASFLFVSCTSVKLEKKIMDWIEVYTNKFFYVVMS